MRYSLGLDIGIASVGWCVVDLDREKIAGLGVRTFPEAENPKDGSSLASARREARSVRRRLSRRRGRLEDIKKMLLDYGLFSSKDELMSVFDACYETPYELRAKGLDEKLTPQEWARVLLHIAKHRGFKSNRKSERKETEAGKLISGVEENSKLLSDKGYRTAGEMLHMDPKFELYKRNKSGGYKNTLLRQHLLEEIQKLFESQRQFGNQYTASEMESIYTEIFARQKAFSSAEDIISKVGYCTFEKDEKRAPKACYTAEYFRLLQNMNNLRIIYEVRERILSSSERELLLERALVKEKLKYADVRQTLDLPIDHRFNIPYRTRIKADKKEKSKSMENDIIPMEINEKDEVLESEKKTFAEMKCFCEIRKSISKADKSLWEKISSNIEILDNIAYVLTVNKDDDSIKGALSQYIDNPEVISELLGLSYIKFQHLSLTAMRRIIPFLEDGMKYSEACEKAGYCHYNPNSLNDKSKLLPPLVQDEIRNPVVTRALAQLRKVVNAIIRKYGSPEEVHIELARDLSKPFDERKKIEKEQSDNRAERERSKTDITETFRIETPSGEDILKFRLFREQHGVCAYSQKPFDRNSIFEPNYAEIDHIIPYSRSFNDGYVNKVLVLCDENRNKSNRTPFEYMSGNPERWGAFEGWVKSTIRNNAKRQNLLKESFDENEMRDRSLNDTRYITAFVADWIRNTLAFSESDKKINVVCVNGRFTANLRARWGLSTLKNREESDVHHALDAAIVAVVTHGMNKRVAEYSKLREMNAVKIEDSTGKHKRDPFPEPWQGFRHEIKVLLSTDPQKELLKTELPNYSDEEKASIGPIFVSRMPTRKATGEAHDATVRSVKQREFGKDLRGCVSKKRLIDLTASELENMVGKDRDRPLYEALKKRLVEHGNDPKKAFAKDFYKPASPGKTPPVVRSIKVFDNTLSGIEVRDGKAANGEMVRVDIYTKDEKFFIVPHYVDDVARKRIKKLAIPTSKSKDGKKEWDRIDDSYKFCFSLFKNDLVKIIDSKGEEFFGYYNTTDIDSGRIVVQFHDKKNKERISTKTSKLFEKYVVSSLGEYYRVGYEKPPVGKNELENSSDS